ncbi:hypothetical protein C8J57DRAFT_1245830 [Mycena rebaudengoi]|nr:hypothetical protein C8J57DRAFT_1245830 [Mycena rebaudengoi]
MLLLETESAVDEVVLSGKSEAWPAEYIAGFAEVVKSPNSSTLRELPFGSLINVGDLDVNRGHVRNIHDATVSAKNVRSMPPTEKKQKEMFKPYDTVDVPDHMPFPEVAGVATTKNHETAVPKLNNHQRSWIHDVALRLVDFSNLKSKSAAREFYTQVKIDAFLSKAFKHVPRPEDLVEESRIPSLVAGWKLAHPKKNGKKTVATPDGDTSDNEEDEGGRTNLLRGYTMAGWRTASPPSLLFSSFRASLTNLKAIQKVISNKRSAEMAKLKSKNDNDLAEAEAATSQLLSKLLGLATYTGRDKFRGDRHDEILAHSKTLPGTSNAGSMFRKAEGVLWAAEPQDAWEAAANSNEGVDWVERQALVPLGFKPMVNQLNSSGKFMPFLAMMLMAWVDADGKVHIDWTEGTPPGIAVPHTFIKQHGHLVQHTSGKLSFLNLGKLV